MTGESPLAAARSCVVLPPDGKARLRDRLGLSGTEKPRIAFISGPGDVVGTFGHWISGRHDPRVPVVTYSDMFYSLVAMLEAETLILHEVPESPRQTLPGFRFIHTRRQRQHGSSLGYVLEETRFAMRVARHLREFQPHIVIVGTDAPIVTLFLVPRGTRIILSAHNTYWPMGPRPTSLRKRVRLQGIARALRRVTAAVCTSPACAAQIAELTGKDQNLFVEMPQLPAGLPAPVRDDFPAARRLLFAGRIEEYKGVFDVLRAFEALWCEFPDLKLAFAGSGTAQHELARQASGSPAAGQIRILGQLTSVQMLAELQHSDLLVCPTRTAFNEGLALVVLEAAACGTPSVVSSVVPARELAAQACVEFEADDVTALTVALGTVVRDPLRFQQLKQATSGLRQRMLDRRLSWGSCLYQAMIC